MHKGCIICQRFFETDNENARMCTMCREEFENNRIICRDYLLAHPGATLSELSHATKIPVRKIVYLIEDGSIEYVDPK